MTFLECNPPECCLAEELQAISEGAGLHGDDIVSLLCSGLSMNDVLEYVEALASNRVH